MTIKHKVAIAALGVVLAFNALSAEAGSRKRHSAPLPTRTRVQAAAPVHHAPQAQSVYVCVVDNDGATPARTCQSLEDDRFNLAVDQKIPPASLTKIVTAYMVYKHMQAHGHQLDDPFLTLTAGDTARGRLGERDGVVSDLGGHIVPIRPGTPLTYRETILGMTALSANNVAVAAGRALASDGEESTFARDMTSMVRSLGLTQTTFRNASGMPWTGQITTAREMALLMDHIVTDLGTNTFRELYGQSQIHIAGRPYNNIIRLIREETEGVVGAKTGTQNGVCNIAIYSERNGVGTVTVVMGSPNGAARNNVALSTIRHAYDAVRNMMASPTLRATGAAQLPRPSQISAETAKPQL